MGTGGVSSSGSSSVRKPIEQQAPAEIKRPDAATKPAAGGKTEATPAPEGPADAFVGASESGAQSKVSKSTTGGAFGAKRAAPGLGAAPTSARRPRSSQASSTGRPSSGREP